MKVNDDELRFLMDSYKQRILELESKTKIMIKDFKSVALSIATTGGNRDARVKYYEDTVKYIEEKYENTI